MLTGKNGGLQSCLKKKVDLPQLYLNVISGQSFLNAYKVNGDAPYAPPPQRD